MINTGYTKMDSIKFENKTESDKIKLNIQKRQRNIRVSSFINNHLGRKMKKIQKK